MDQETRPSQSTEQIAIPEAKKSWRDKLQELAEKGVSHLRRNRGETLIPQEKDYALVARMLIYRLIANTESTWNSAYQYALSKQLEPLTEDENRHILDLRNSRIEWVKRASLVDALGSHLAGGRSLVPTVDKYFSTIFKS